MTSPFDNLGTFSVSTQETQITLLNVVRDGVILVAPSEDAPIISYNLAFASLFHFQDETLNNQSWWDILNRTNIPLTTIEAMRRLWAPPKDQGTPILNGEFTLSNPHGTDFVIEWASSFQPQLTCYVFTFHDVTPERVSERLRTDLISRVSHELRTPLTAISGFAEFILELGEEELPDIAREYTQIILNSARHLSGVFTDIIEFSRVNSGGVELYLNSALVQDVVTQIVARVETQSTNHQQKIILDLDHTTPATLVDIDRINQVITHLLVNAMKYAPDESEIKIMMHQVKTRAELPTSAPPELKLPAVLVSILDGGEGIEESEVHNIFLPFYRAPNADAQHIEGAGLGLAIAHRLVRLHQGQIWAQANKETGSGGCFYFTLPLIDKLN